MKFIDFFDRAYVLNLPERRDRRRAITAELEKFGLPFTPGKVELFAAIRPQDPGPFQSIGIYGCYLSHLTVLKHAYEKGVSNVLVMEDDLEIYHDFCRYEDTLIQELSHQDWDYVHFGHSATVPCPGSGVAESTLQPFAGEFTGAHFYAVNGNALGKLIDFLELLLKSSEEYPTVAVMPIDGAFNVFKWQFPQVNRLIAVPSLGGQRSSRSSITPGWYDRVPILRYLIGLARSFGILKRLKDWAKSF